MGIEGEKSMIQQRQMVEMVVMVVVECRTRVWNLPLFDVSVYISSVCVCVRVDVHVRLCARVMQQSAIGSAGAVHLRGVSTSESSPIGCPFNNEYLAPHPGVTGYALKAR